MTTLKDVAAKAGVSASTVSRVLRGSEPEQRFSAECINRVRAAASALGYEGNDYARLLRTRGAGAVAINVGGGDLAQGRLGAMDPYRSLVMTWAMRSLQRLYREVVALGWQGDRVPATLMRQGFASGRFAGALIIPGFDHDAVIDAVPADRPCVLIDLPEHPSNRPRVSWDEEHGARLVAEHLLGLGHRRLWWLGFAGVKRQTSRGQAFLTTCAQAGAQAIEQQVDDPRLADMQPAEQRLWAGRAAAELVQARFVPGAATAIACATDDLAFGAMHALLTMGMPVPRAVSVTGIDDFWGGRCLPPLTTIINPIDLMAECATDLLEQLLSADPRHESRPVVRPLLCVRASTAPASA